MTGNLEAIKRALFIIWYEGSEPYWLSGIRDLPQGQKNIFLRDLESRVIAGEIDGELKEMLRYYFKISDWYLNDPPGLDNLKSISIPQLETLDSIQVDSLSNRGILGFYWKPVCKNWNRLKR